nr:ATP synthase F0 subunit 8 [Rhinoprosopa nasuta]
MPQMAPISWLSLLFFFTIIFLLFNIMNYFIYNIPMPSKLNNMFKNKVIIMNWKW